MAEVGNLESDEIKEVVEKILAQLHINGTIQDGALPKEALRKATIKFVDANNVTNFTYNDMPKTLLKYDFCYYMNKNEAHKSKVFKVNVAKITELANKYPNVNVEVNPEVPEKVEASSAYSIEHVLTTEQKGIQQFQFSDKSCFVCRETFNQQGTFVDHMKGHGMIFQIDATDCLKEMIRLNEKLSSKHGKFICTITSRKNIKVDRVTLVLPPNNDFHILSMCEEGKSTKFDIEFEVLPKIDHPYSILVFYKQDSNLHLLTQYHLTMNKLQHHNDITLEKIKDKSEKILMPRYLKMKLEDLECYYPSKEMNALFRKDFKRERLTEKEKQLNSTIEHYLNSEVTKGNYVNFWSTFIQMEDSAASEQLSKIDKFKVNLIYSQGYYLLHIPNLLEENMLMEGDKVHIVESKGQLDHLSSQTIRKLKKSFGRVYELKKDHVVLDFEDMIVLKDLKYDIHFLTNRMTIQLERQALDFVEQHKIQKFFFPECLTKHSIDFHGFDWVNESIKTNPEQQSAVIHIVQKSSFPSPYILMGPPGTGKTTTLVEAIYQILMRSPNDRILVAATSNYACDVITIRLLKFLQTSQVYRMFASSKEQNLDSIDPKLLEISNLKGGTHYYPTIVYLSKFSVILTTLAIAGKFAQARIHSGHFQYVFIDEAGSSTEPSTLIPIAGVISSPGMIHGQIVLAGDPMQLGPIVKCDRASKHLGVSMLERLIDKGIYAKDSNGKYNPRAITKLLRNFRSHPKILEFPDKEFYSGELMAMGSYQLTRWACDWAYLPNKNVPILFEHVIGVSEQDDNSPSWYNKQEVRRVIFYIHTLLKANKIHGREITQKCIGVITPYKKQCTKLSIECKKRQWDDIDIGPVEKFQGQEKSVIILSTVRSLTRGVGFLKNPKRLNVALTRAQALLIIIGNVDTLEHDDTWSRFIDFCKENGVIKKFVEEDEQEMDQHTSQRKQPKQNQQKKTRGGKKGKNFANSTTQPVVVKAEKTNRDLPRQGSSGILGTQSNQPRGLLANERQNGPSMNTLKIDLLPKLPTGVKAENINGYPPRQGSSGVFNSQGNQPRGLLVTDRRNGSLGNTSTGFSATDSLPKLPNVPTFIPSTAARYGTPSYRSAYSASSPLNTPSNVSATARVNTGTPYGRFATNSHLDTKKKSKCLIM
ncbi:putative helicase MOV-10 isoform X2 [Lutzomyia longipalpis]|uniref:Putative dna helicase n=1 Tax=Lutzomyia longipalpis TaxID=7200 RepID=A0A7G3AFT2_LUTLO|nr:putative helicase MOV-10 isoform X2 [Lutzomyia longipalpis]XP_055679176.1 putative helicase MOV-10 isoform X2 [Lutzomyia longipalpis]